MVNQQLRVDSKQLIQQIFGIKLRRISDRTTRNIAHRKKSVRFQFFRVAPADAPEIGQRTVRPKHLTVAHFVKLRNSDTVLIRRNMLCDDIHCDFAEI